MFTDAKIQRIILQSKLFLIFYKVMIAPSEEEKKLNKICNYENCPYLCSVVWFKGSFTLLWLPFSKRKIGCLNVPSTVQTQGNIKHESGFPRMMR